MSTDTQKKRGYVWELAYGKTAEWHLYMFPFTLIIEYKANMNPPYVGSIKAGQIVLGEFHAWPSSEEAARGMIEWGLAELSESYHELLKLRGT
jgi:hypothetical protein